jgi:plasmid stabilization system protein ParE
MLRVLWTPVAESDPDDILFQIAFIDRNPSRGERIYFEIRDCVTKHFENRVPGHGLPGAPEDWLYLRYKRWLIFYQTHFDRIDVMRVIDAVRDLPKYLGGQG